MNKQLLLTDSVSHQVSQSPCCDVECDPIGGWGWWLTDDGEGISVSAGRSQHRAAVGEAHGEAAHVTAPERQHGLVGDPTHLAQNITNLRPTLVNYYFPKAK